MSDEKDILDIARSNSGLIGTFLMGTWAVILRFLIGRHVKHRDEEKLWIEKVNMLLSSLQEGQSDIRARLTEIESRSHQRRRGDR
jgi:hypothetical protein